MQTRDFCFWLQGFFELNPDSNKLSKEQVELIKTHLDLVFKHDPSIDRKKMEHPYLPASPIKEWPPRYAPGYGPDERMIVTC